MGLEFTGERYIPGEGSAEMLYEHLHRYLFASLVVGGKRVLDLGSGEGYGSALLSASAREVVGIDIAMEAVRHAAGRYSRRGLSFLAADCAKLPFSDARFDIVIAFELLEHIAEQEELLAEARRVLAEDGLLLLSSPERSAYSEQRGYRNPFHVRELNLEEMVSLLESFFPSVMLFGQRVLPSSYIWRLDGRGEGGDKLWSRQECAFQPEAGKVRQPLYLLAICGKKQTISGLPARSALIDRADQRGDELAQQIGGFQLEIERLNSEIAELARWGRTLDGEIAARDRTIRSLQAELAEARRAAAEEIARLNRELDERAVWARGLEDACRDRDATIRRQLAENERLLQQILAIKTRPTYKLLRRLRLLP